MVDLKSLILVVESGKDFYLKSAKLIDAINRYLGFVESLDAKVDKLAHVELNSAFQYLNQAKNSNLPKIQYDCLNSARVSFTKALYLEEGEALVSAYIGLVLCFSQLDDWANVVSTLNEFSSKKINIKSFKGAISNKLYLNERAEAAKKILEHSVPKYYMKVLKPTKMRKFLVTTDRFIGVSRKQDTIWDLQEEAKHLASNFQELTFSRSRR